MQIKGVLISICIVLMMLSCAFKRTTELSNKVSLGMSKNRVIQICGKPYKISARRDRANNLEEVLFYKEKTWDDGFWSSSTTITNHIFIFKNGELVAIEQGEEEYNNESYNILFTF